LKPEASSHRGKAISGKALTALAKEDRSTQWLKVEAVEVDAHCVGSRWTTVNKDELERIVAIVAMGQATHAAQIITELSPAATAITHQALIDNAKASFSIKGDTDSKRDVSRYHRDGLIFKVISWAAAQQAAASKILMRDPHVSSTTQGLDGLMIELDADGSIKRAIIFEDKRLGISPRRSAHLVQSVQRLDCFPE
jgi:hypothetical protein